MVAGELHQILGPEALPKPLSRLKSHTALIRVIRTEDIETKGFAVKEWRWLLLFPRSRGQDLRKDIRETPRVEFPVTAYVYDAGSTIETPLAWDCLHDLGLCSVRTEATNSNPTERR